jgi:hypothetical protein
MLSIFISGQKLFFLFIVEKIMEQVFLISSDDLLAANHTESLASSVLASCINILKVTNCQKVINVICKQN